MRSLIFIIYLLEARLGQFYNSPSFIHSEGIVPQIVQPCLC